MPQRKKRGNCPIGIKQQAQDCSTEGVGPLGELKWVRKKAHSELWDMSWWHRTYGTALGDPLLGKCGGGHVYMVMGH